MNRSEDKDPTCVIKMLDDFRSSASSRRTIMGGNMFPFNIPQSTTKPTRLDFDDSLSQSQNESGASKRIKLGEDSIDSSIDSKISESSVMGKLDLSYYFLFTSSFNFLIKLVFINLGRASRN